MSLNHGANSEPVVGPTARDAAGADSGLDDLKRELFDVPLSEADGPFGRTDVSAHPSTRLIETTDLSYAAMEAELDLVRKRLAIWDIFLARVKAGATSWPEVQRALTAEDLREIVRICNGRSLRDLLVRLR